MIDTLAISKRLQKAGDTPEHADAVAEVFGMVLQENVVTKSDLREACDKLDKKIDSVAARLDKKIDSVGIYNFKAIPKGAVAYLRSNAVLRHKVLLVETGRWRGEMDLLKNFFLRDSHLPLLLEL